VKPTDEADAGESVRLPTMLPFLSAVNSPLVDPVVWIVLLFVADGFLPPPFTHSYVTVSLAESVTVSVEPDGSPASLNVTVRFAPSRLALVAFLMKCGLPANAGVAPRARVANTATGMRNFFIAFPLHSGSP
jgi:hypothetical protein